MRLFRYLLYFIYWYKASGFTGLFTGQFNTDDYSAFTDGIDVIEFWLDRYQRFDNRLEDKPQVRTPICQSLVCRSCRIPDLKRTKCLVFKTRLEYWTFKVSVWSVENSLKYEASNSFKISLSRTIILKLNVIYLDNSYFDYGLL